MVSFIAKQRLVGAPAVVFLAMAIWLCQGSSLPGAIGTVPVSENDAAAGVGADSVAGASDPLAEEDGENFPRGKFPVADPVATWDPILTFTAPDERFSLNLRGRIQARYEFERRDEDDPIKSHSSFSIRRARLDFRGHAYTRDLTYRLMPEWNRQATMRDAWANYRFSDDAEVRFGQFNVPFAWERDSSTSRHQFVERTIANDEFNWETGIDIGAMIHGIPSERLRYAAAVLGGEGRNLRRTGSEGNLFVGRATYALLGSYPEMEALVQPVDEVNLALGGGLGYANKNAARDWHFWSDPDAIAQAHVSNATADVHYQHGAVSTHLTGFARRVSPRGELDSYDGFGFSAQAGYLLIPEKLFGAVRYSWAEPNRDERQGRAREILAGVQIFHFGHNSKIHLETGFLEQHDGTDWRETQLVRCQYQLLF